MVAWWLALLPHEFLVTDEWFTMENHNLSPPENDLEINNKRAQHFSSSLKSDLMKENRRNEHNVTQNQPCKIAKSLKEEQELYTVWALYNQ